MLHGVDVSAYQPDWLPESVDKFVFIKLTEGRTWRSSVAFTQTGRAREKKLQLGFYHYLWPGNAVEQAAWFVKNLGNLVRPGDLLVCDWENTKDGHPSVQDAAVFIAEVKRLMPGYKVGLYCNRSDWLGTAVKAGDFLWLAVYNGKDDPGATGWLFWQYTDKPIDQNWASPRWDSLDALKEWAGTNRIVHYSETWKSDYISFSGSESGKDWVIPLDRQIVLACAKEVGWGSVRVTQGGRRPETSFSGTTHTGLGVLDIMVDDRSKALVWAFAAAMNRSGLRAFPRGFGGDPWANEQHLHVGSRENYDHAASSLQTQIREVEKGGDGLKGDGRYNGPPLVTMGRWGGSPYNPINVRLEPGRYRVDPAKVSSFLVGNTVDGVHVKSREPGYELNAVKLIKRWDRWNAVTATPTYYALDYLKEL
jgi:Glycosyl hydrolases family 25